MKNTFHASSIIHRDVEWGTYNNVYPFCTIGLMPQTSKPPGRGKLIVGNNNIFREYVSVHPGTAGQNTTIGDANLLMAYAHIGHDSRCGNNNIIGHRASIGGHCAIGDKVAVGAHAIVLPNITLGHYSYISPGAIAHKNVPPFAFVMGHRRSKFRANIRRMIELEIERPDILKFAGICRSGSLSELDGFYQQVAAASFESDKIKGCILAFEAAIDR